MKEQLQRAKQSLEAEPTAAPTTSDADGAADEQAPASGGASAGRAQQRAKKADDYHGRHKDWVGQFNELTGGECAGGESGVKWAAVRAWQQRHWQLNNLLADGLIGPKTIEAAKLLAKKNAPKKADDEKEGADAKEHAAPEPGQADGAEASADKPKLDDTDVDAQIAPPTAGASAAAPLSPSAPKKQATLVEFDGAAAKLETLMASFKQPEGQGPQKPIAQHYVEGTDDKEAPAATGAMMSKGALVGYEDSAKKLVGNWDSLKQPHARAQFLLEAVNQSLATEKVPGIQKVQLEKMLNPGEFEAAQWLMKMNETLFGTDSFDNKEKEILEIASKVFHEGRHAEQRFSIARLVASKPGMSIADVATKAHVPKEIATEAVALRGEQMSPEQQHAAEEFKKDTVDNPEHQQIEESSAAITDAANHAAAMFHALSPEDQAIAAGRWQDLRQRAIASLEAYYHFATERDAYAAQRQLAAANK